MYLTTNQSDKIQILHFGNTPFFSPHGTLFLVSRDHSFRLTRLFFSPRETVFFISRDESLHLPIEKHQKPTILFLRKHPEEYNIPQYPGNDSTTQHTELCLVQQLRISTNKRQVGYEQRHRKANAAQQ